MPRHIVIACLAAAWLCSDTPVRGQGPNPVGRPKQFEQGRSTVCAVWYEDGWWVIRATSDAKGGNRQFDTRHVFEGTVRVTGGRVTKMDLSTLDRSAKAKDADFVNPAGTGFDFRFVTFGGIDGMKFKVADRAQSVEFTVKVDADDNPKKVRIGAAGVHPDAATFSLPAKPGN